MGSCSSRHAIFAGSNPAVSIRTFIFDVIGAQEKSDLRLAFNKAKRTASDDDHLSVEEFCELVGEERRPFTERVFRTADDDNSGSVDFDEFCYLVHAYISLEWEALVRFAFQLYCSGKHDLLSLKDLRSMVQNIHGSNATVVESIMRTVIAAEGPHPLMNLADFTSFCRSHASLLQPMFMFQHKMKLAIARPTMAFGRACACALRAAGKPLATVSSTLTNRVCHTRGAEGDAGAPAVTIYSLKWYRGARL